MHPHSICISNDKKKKDISKIKNAANIISVLVVDMSGYDTNTPSILNFEVSFFVSIIEF